MRTPPTPLILSFSLAITLGACRKDKDGEEEVPTGLEPLEDNQAERPSKTDGSYPDTYNVVSGQADDYAWAHAIGTINAPITTIWGSFSDPDVVVDRRRMESWEATMDVADFDVSFLIDHVTDDIVTIEFQLTWIEGVTTGTVDAPESVGLRWAKTGGSDLVYLLEGSAVLTELESGVTEVQLIEHLDTPGSGPEDVEAYYADLWASVLADSSGEPLPTYE